MFIAVVPYKQKNSHIGENVLVFDTDDLSIAWVAREDLNNARIKVHYGMPLTALNDVVPNNIIMLGIPRRVWKNTGVAFHVCDVSCVVLDSHTAVNLNIVTNYDDFKINDFVICKCIAEELMYAFRYKDGYLLRMMYTDLNGERFKWMSVYIDKNGNVKNFWNEDLSIVSNKAFALQADMTLAY